MKLKLRNTITFLLLIAGLVIFSHSILPHDHHYDNYSETNHDEHQERDKSGNEPIHCHFFNNVVINKVSPSYQKFIVQVTLVFDFISEIDFDFDDNSILKAIFYNNFYYPDYLAFLDSSPTRGSPIS